MDNKIFKDISYGMYIVSTKDEKRVGCVINTLSQITSKDPVVAISLNKENYTNQVLRKTKKLGISILSEETNPETISKFGFFTSKEVDKFSDISYEEIDNIPIVNDAVCGYIIGEVINIIDVGTHDIFLVKVTSSKKINDYKPMTYRYYQEVIKGSSPSKAPTYIENKSLKNVWVCSVCGYVHEGDIDDNFVCPICGVDRSYFKKKE